ncbi:MAG: acyltransferase [Holophaga sp.]|nr:acyltransferase [Holophaga sp.]
MLRGLMALAVAFYHFTIWYPVFQPGRFMAYTAAKAGHYGVEGFFIISGFCFFHIYGPGSFRGRGLWNFHIKRFLRIAPLYYLAVALNMALGLTVGPPANGRMLLENATLTFGLFHPNHSLVLGGWSIGIEYVFYMVFPLLAWAAGRYRPFLALATLVMVLLSVPYTLWLVPAASMTGDMKFHTYVQLANHGFLFFLGGLVAQARARIPWRLTRLSFLILGVGLGLMFSRYIRNFYDHFVVMEGPPRYAFAALCLGMVALFAFRDFPESRLKRAGIFLGEVSYSVYLIHPFAQEALLRLVPGGLPPVLGFTLGLVMTLLVATLTHRLIERPAMNLGRRLTAK